MLNMPGLTAYEFELIIPHDQYSCPFAIYDNGYQPPQHYFDLFEKLKTDSTVENRAFPFVVVDNSDSPTLISTICTLEDYEISQDADEDILDYRVNLRLENMNGMSHNPFRCNKMKMDRGLPLMMACTTDCRQPQMR